VEIKFEFHMKTASFFFTVQGQTVLVTDIKIELTEREEILSRDIKDRQQI
jgi:hypothetical protein